MNKIKIRIIILGHLPADIELTNINEWRSDIFELQGLIENYALRSDSDTEDWGYTDQNISGGIPNRGDEEILFVLMNVPLEDNYYTRRINNNTVVFTFHEISGFLRQQNIPLENVIYRLLYAYSFVYKEHNNKIPQNSEYTNFTHDETRRCIYDMNGLKEDIVFSCVEPIICLECSERLAKNKISQTQISRAKNELRNIKKQLFYRISDWVKRHPVLTVVVSSIWALILSILGSVIVNGIST